MVACLPSSINKHKQTPVVERRGGGGGVEEDKEENYEEKGEEDLQLPNVNDALQPAATRI